MSKTAFLVLVDGLWVAFVSVNVGAVAGFGSALGLFFGQLIYDKWMS